MMSLMGIHWKGRSLLCHFLNIGVASDVVRQCYLHDIFVSELRVKCVLNVLDLLEPQYIKRA